MTEQLGKKSFFQKLKETVRTINESVSEINVAMAIPKCDLPEHSALKSLNKLQDELDTVTNETECLEKDLVKVNNHAQCFNIGMEELVSDMEYRMTGIIDHVTKFGYQPEQDVEHGIKQFSTPAHKTKESNAKSEAGPDRTPLPIDFGLLSTNKLNSKTNTQTSVCLDTPSHRKPMKLQKQSKIGDQIYPNSSPASEKKQCIKEHKKLTVKLEEILEKTPKIGDYSASNRQFYASPQFPLNKRNLNSNKDSTEEIGIVKSLELNDFSEKQESTPELPLSLPLNSVRLSQKEKVHITPEGPPDMTLSKDKIFNTPEAPTRSIKVSVKEVDKTPELNLTHR